MMDDSVRSSGSDSPGSGDLSDQTEKKEPISPQNLNDYADVVLVQGNSPSYTTDLQQQDTSELPSFSVSEFILFGRSSIACLIRVS